jgi:hypothetical protein
MTLFDQSGWHEMPRITWYRASDHYPDGLPLWTRADIAKVRRWLAKQQLQLEAE